MLQRKVAAVTTGAHVCRMRLLTTGRPQPFTAGLAHNVQRGIVTPRGCMCRRGIEMGGARVHGVPVLAASPQVLCLSSCTEHPFVALVPSLWVASWENLGLFGMTHEHVLNSLCPVLLRYDQGELLEVDKKPWEGCCCRQTGRLALHRCQQAPTYLCTPPAVHGYLQHSQW